MIPGHCGQKKEKKLDSVLDVERQKYIVLKLSITSRCSPSILFSRMFSFARPVWCSTIVMDGSNLYLLLRYHASFCRMEKTTFVVVVVMVDL